MDQANPLNIGNYIREALGHCSPVPINLALYCSSQFAHELGARIDILEELGILLPINFIEHPNDIYSMVGRDLTYHENNSGIGIRLNLLINDDYQWPLFAQEHDNLTDPFIQFLEEMSGLMRTWAPPLRWDYPYKIDESVMIQHTEIFYETIESIGANIDEGLIISTVQNDLGRFEINLISGTVSFIPVKCIECKNKCNFVSKSLCIVQNTNGSTSGWSNFGIPKKYLLTLAKIFAVKNKSFTQHVWNQIQSKSICSRDKANNPVPTITGLRDEMLRELSRLKRIMSGED